MENPVGLLSGGQRQALTLLMATLVAPKLLLLDEDASITYVAEASGFANANYFAKVFRRETGMSPSEYLAAAPKKQEHPQMPQNRRLPW